MTCDRCPTVTEVWGVDYHDNCGPHRAPSRAVAQQWVDNYNGTVMADPEAVLVRRTITTSPWEVVS